jgi:hypothetical protein
MATAKKAAKSKAPTRKPATKKSAATTNKKSIAANSKKGAKPATSSTSTAVAVVQKLRLKSSNYQEMHDNWEVAEREKEDVIRGWARRLVETKNKMRQVNEQYKKLMLGFLQEAYAVYVEIENSEYADEFYANVRWQLKTDEIKIQSNTPNAGLVIRFVCGADIATKTISDYSRVLEGARRNEISPTTFSEWVKSKTMTKVIEDERAASSRSGSACLNSFTPRDEDVAADVNLTKDAEIP